MQTFLSAFTHRFLYEDNEALYDILNNQSYWVKSIPHEYSGPCFTYNPQLQSVPGYWFSMGIIPYINQEGGGDYNERKRNLLNNDLKIFLHEPNKFFFFKEEEAPNNIGIDLKWMQLWNRTRIVGKQTIYNYSQVDF